jgi:NDP-sugar pyrophosphorylase family protein
MRAIILVGGLGTRLRAIVSDRPKPMALVCGKPFLEHQITHLARHGITEVVLCAGHMADMIRAHFGEGSWQGIRIHYSVEASLLGTGGAVRNARDLIHDRFLLLNGDSFIDVDVRDFRAAHERAIAATPNLLGTICAREIDDSASFGRLDVAADGRLIAFREKGVGGPGLVNAGLYMLEPSILALIPDGRPVSLEREVFPSALEMGRPLHVYPSDAYFMDIGTPQGYSAFCRYIQERDRRAIDRSMPQ